MKIGVVQFAPLFGEPEENIRRIEARIRPLDADLWVLPELATTGYQFDSEEEVAALAESVDRGDSVKRLQRLSEEKDCLIVAGLAEADAGAVYNASVLIDGSGVIGTYRKIHLFREEKRWFVPGDLGYPVWDVGGVRIGMMICFDWIFPEAARVLALKGADLICHPANLVLPFCQDAMVTRSIENRVYTITANRVGSEKRGARPGFNFTGGSQVVGPSGIRFFRLGEKEEAAKTVELDPKAARNKAITAENDLFCDRSPGMYGGLTDLMATRRNGSA